MKILLKILDFCSLLDYSGARLSISNIAVISLVTKLALTSNPDLATIGVTVVSLLNYMHKRNENAKTGSSNQDSSDSA